MTGDARTTPELLQEDWADLLELADESALQSILSDLVPPIVNRMSPLLAEDARSRSRLAGGELREAFTECLRRIRDDHPGAFDEVRQRAVDAWLTRLDARRHRGGYDPAVGFRMVPRYQGEQSVGGHPPEGKSHSTVEGRMHSTVEGRMRCRQCFLVFAPELGYAIDTDERVGAVVGAYGQDRALRILVARAREQLGSDALLLQELARWDAALAAGP
jgi:hypothetical protein